MSTQPRLPRNKRHSIEGRRAVDSIVLTNRAVLRQYRAVNPGSTVAVDIDQQGRFFRAFISSGGVV